MQLTSPRETKKVRAQGALFSSHASPPNNKEEKICSASGSDTRKFSKVAEKTHSEHGRIDKTAKILHAQIKQAYRAVRLAVKRDVVGILVPFMNLKC